MRAAVLVRGPWALVMALGLVSGACKPWTVRPIQKSAEDASASTPKFDARTYVDSIWDARVVSLADSTAEELAAVVARLRSADATGARTDLRRSMLVKGRAEVLEVDRRSRVGLLYVGLHDGRDTPRIALQIGPVLRGTALRDALPFIRFSDFLNQIDFATVATELNARVLRTVLEGVNTDTLKGRTISFNGAATVAGTSAPALEIVPLTLRIEAPGR